MGRLLVVLQLLIDGVLSEPTLSVSPWFEARRAEYDDLLLEVSTRGAWDEWIKFFAAGLEASAVTTHGQILGLLGVRDELRTRIERSALRSPSAYRLVDLALARTSFTARQVQHDLAISYPRANTLISQLVGLDVLRPVRADATYDVGATPQR